MAELDCGLRIALDLDAALAAIRATTPALLLIHASSGFNVVEACRARWQQQATSRGRKLLIVLSGGRRPVYGSRTAIDQILDVLISNSLDHGEGTVTVTARSIAGGATIDVTDEGGGIPEALTEAVFRRGHGHGSGIGLGLARSLAEADGGRLLLIANAPPQFRLLLTGQSSETGDEA